MRLFLPILVASFLPFAAAREVVQLTWPTRHASPAPNLPKQTSDWLPAFRVALAALPESATVALSLAQPALLGISSEDAAKMQPLIAKRYTAIASDSAFARAASALPYCFSAQQPASGLAFLYIPDHAGPQTEAIVFLHGYGASFLWYQYSLAEIFPDSLIIAPAYGLATPTVPNEYVTEAVQAAEHHLGFPLSGPNGWAFPPEDSARAASSTAHPINLNP